LKQIFLIFCFGSTAISLVAQDPFVFKWVKQVAGANGSVRPGQIAVDNSGNIYTAWLFAGAVDFDPGPAAYNLTAENQRLYPDTMTSVLCKVDANGNFVWAKKFSPDLNANPYGLSIHIMSICCDPAGNVYATGGFTGTVDFDPGPGVYNLTAVSRNAFVLKLDACGDFLWAIRLPGGEEDDYGSQTIVPDRFGHLIVGGQFVGLQDFDPGPGIINLNSYYINIYICKLDTAGNFIWAIAPGFMINNGWANGSWLAVDNSGNIYSTGGFEGAADFGGIQLNAVGYYDIYIWKIDPAGNSTWAKDIGGPGPDQPFSIGVDATGNIYTTGMFSGTVDFDPGPAIYNLVSNGTGDPTLAPALYISKLNSNGDFVFAERMFDNAVADSWAVSAGKIPVDDSGNIYLTGLFKGTADLDPGPGVSNFTSIGQSDMYVSEVSPSGSLVWANRIGGAGNGSAGESIAIDAQNIYTTGWFDGTVDFDPSTAVYNLTSVGPSIPNYPPTSGFIHKMTKCINTTYSTLNILDCKPVQLNCRRYDSSGTFTQALTNSMGCDSIITLNLVINRISSQASASACNSYSWHGNTYDTSGDYTDTLTATNGCDSIVTLHLVMKAKSYSSITQSICADQSFNGHTSPGTYVDTLVASNGCDSIITLNLLTSGIFSQISASACDSYSWRGNTYNTSGDYSDTLTTGSGCDSIITLHLTMNKSYSNITQSICAGQSFDGHTSPGTYVDTLVASNGCDSIRTLHLVTLPAPLPQLGADTSICDGDFLLLSPGLFNSYLWQDGSTQSRFVVTQPGLYRVTVSDSCGTATDEILISQKICNIYFPSAFTPNADGKNDLFRMIGPHSLYDFRLSIYNRWGQLVFTTNDTLNGWDGTLNGKLQPSGTYVWFCEFKKSNAQQTTRVKGTITLIR
jgi:gliding motility-associated-like protein